MVLNARELRKGLLIDLDGEIYRILEFHHLKLGRGSAQVRLRLKNVVSGQVLERTFQSTHSFTLASLEQRPGRFLYLDRDLGYFMDESSYEQIAMDKEKFAPALPFLKEGAEVKLSFYKDEPVGIELPPSVELRVIETAPSFKGDTASSGSKPAKLETGYVIQVPFFIQAGESIKVDTRTGEYLERV